MSKILVKYIRVPAKIVRKLNTSRYQLEEVVVSTKIIGCVVATGRDKVGYSLYNEKAEKKVGVPFDKRTAKELAAGRALLSNHCNSPAHPDQLVLDLSVWPPHKYEDLVLLEVERMVYRSRAYFKENKEEN